MRRTLLPLGLLGLLTLVPTVAARECTFDQKDLCDVARDMMLDDAFGAQADVALVVGGVLAAAFVLFLLAWLVRHLKPSRVLRVSTSEKMKEVEPGATAQFRVNVSNHLSRLPVEVYAERPPLPEGWSTEVAAHTILPSGFKVPQELPEATSLALASAARGGNEALIEVRLTPPATAKFEETLDYEMRLVPVVRGKLRKGKAKKARLTVLVTPHVPVVQITKVLHTPERISPGNPVLTRAILVNRGEREARDVSVIFSLNGSELDKKIVPQVGVAGEAEVEFNWIPQAGENKIRVAVGP